MIEKHELNKKIMEDHSIKEYALYEEASQSTTTNKIKPPKPIERHTRQAHPMDNPAEHMWYGEWEDTTAIALQEYQTVIDELRKPKLKTNLSEIDKIRAKIEKCQAMLDKLKKEEETKND